MYDPTTQAILDLLVTLSPPRRCAALLMIRTLQALESCEAQSGACALTSQSGCRLRYLSQGTCPWPAWAGSHYSCNRAFTVVVLTTQ